MYLTVVAIKSNNDSSMGIDDGRACILWTLDSQHVTGIDHRILNNEDVPRDYP